MRSTVKIAIKRLAQFFSAFAIVVLLLAIAIPFLVDVDQYRPYIEEQVNQRIAGKVKMGGLKLTLWGRLKIEIDGLTLLDPSGKKTLVQVDDAHLDLPFLPIVQGQPRAEFVLETPQVTVIRSAKGRIDLFEAVALRAPKNEVVAAVVPAPKELPATGNAGGDSVSKTVEIPGFLARTVLDVEFLNARVDFYDVESGAKNRLTEINFLMREVSLGKPIEVRLWAEVDSKLGKTLTAKGPFDVNLTAKVPQLMNPNEEPGQKEPVEVSFEVDLDRMDIRSNGQLEKSDDDVLGVKSTILWYGDRVEIPFTEIRFSDARVKFGGRVVPADASRTEIRISSNVFSWKKMARVLPAIPQGLDGTLSLSARATGQKLSSMFLKLRSPKSSVDVKGSIGWTPAMTFDLAVTSPKLDLAPWLATEEKKSSSKASGVPQGKKGQSSSKTVVAVVSADDQLEPLRINQMFRAASGRLSVQIDEISTGEFPLKNFELELFLADLTADLRRFGFNAFNGQVDIKAKANLKPRRPTYSFEAKVRNIDLKSAVTTFAQSLKNTAYGRMDLDLKGSGSSIDPELAKKNLNAKGKFEIRQAKFVSIDVNRMIVVAANGALGRVAKKIPQLKGKKLKGLPKTETVYDWMRSDFSLKQGVFKAPNFVTKVKVKKGIDLAGYTEFNLLNQNLNASWKLKDTYNLTQANKINTRLGSQTVPLLVKKGKTLEVPVKVGCKLSDPCVSYLEAPKHFAKIAGDNLAAAAKKEGQAQLKKITKKQKKKVEKQVRKALKGMFR